MRNLILVFAVLLVSAACRKDNSFNISKIVIKGTISGNQKGAEFKSANQLSLLDATQVLVFNSSGYKLSYIENGSFTTEAISGTATALAFLDSQNRYIGCLCSGGLNVLPLVNLKDGNSTVIDLSALTLDGTSVIPANNPVGDEINLNEEEIMRYKELGVYYESLSKNIDADNDGIPDILNKKDISIGTIFSISCGSWGLNGAPPQVDNASDFFINYNLRLAGGKSIIPSNSNIVVAGPEALPYEDIKQTHYALGPDCFIAFFSRETPAPPGYPFGSASLPFEKGTYLVTLDNKNYTLNYSNISAKHFLILAEPTIHTNNKNEIISISVEYKNMENSLVTPENFVYQTQITLDGYQNNRLFQIGALGENPEAKTNTELYNFVLPDPIPLSELRNLTVGYMDLIGNWYNTGYLE